jgi:hypothetical protein
MRNLGSISSLQIQNMKCQNITVSISENFVSAEKFFLLLNGFLSMRTHAGIVSYSL